MQLNAFCTYLGAGYDGLRVENTPLESEPGPEFGTGKEKWIAILIPKIGSLM